MLSQPVRLVEGLGGSDVAPFLGAYGLDLWFDVLSVRILCA